MSDPYEEIVAGETFLRRSPGVRHEEVCLRLHTRIGASLANAPATRLLEPRSIVELAAGTLIRPDLALVTAATRKLWLAAEIISADDHRADTVTKKAVYEEINLPRLWMIDLRYDNVEVYHSSEYGLKLVHIFAHREVLDEKLLPGFQFTIAELFGL
jgi:Putative restriction endonuclease